MEYTCSIIIHLPRDRVVALFDDTANLKRWQPTLRSVELLEGLPGQVGSRSRLRYQQRGRDSDLIETVTVRALPERFTGTYEMPGTWIEVDNRFEVLDAEETRWTSACEWRCQSLMIRLMTLVVPGMFRKQTQKFMQQFKDFAENQTDEGLERTRYEP